MINTKVLDKYIFYSILGVAVTSCISLGLTNIFTGCAILFSITRVFFKRDDLIIDDKKGLFMVMFIFIIAMTLSALWGGKFTFAFEKYIGHYIFRMSPLIIVLLFIRNMDYIIKLILGAILSLSITNLYAIYEGLNGNFRAQGLSGGPMWLATFLLVLIPIIFVALFDKDKFSKYKMIFSTAFLIAVIALIFNGTRGAWIGSVIILPALGVIASRNIKKFLGAMSIGILFIVIIFSNFTQLTSRVSTISDTQYQSNTERILMWNSAINMAKDSPLFGVGLGNYSDMYKNKYINPLAKEHYQGHAHNNFMQMLGENGLIGLSSFVIMFGYILLFSWRKKQSYFGIMAFGATLGFLFHGLTEYNFGSAGGTKLYWLVLAICLQGALLEKDYIIKGENL